MELAKKEGSNLFISFFDVKKAYDKGDMIVLTLLRKSSVNFVVLMLLAN